jgi:inner membrane protein
MQETPNFFERLNQKIRESLTIKLLTIGILILLLLIPLNMVQDLVRERQSRSNDVIAEVSENWSRAQTLSGPILTIPYTSYEQVTQDKETKTIAYIRYMHLLPDQLLIDGDIAPEKLHRGIYDVVVYKSALGAKGVFNLADVAESGINPEDIKWSQAVINLGITDMRGITEQIVLNLPNQKLACQPGLKNATLGEGGVHADIDLTGLETLPFDFALNLKGSSFLNFLPLARTTEVGLKSDWTSPSFIGAFLPATRDAVNGFPATWKVLNLNRPIPQVVQGDNLNFNEYSFGVELYLPATQYQKSDRTAKYGALVISLVFLIIFFVQIMRKVGVHPFQYILIGLALVIFYTLLLSISEFTTFNAAYLLAAGLVVVLISVYLHGVLQNLRTTGIIFLLQTLIFGFIYVIIQLEDTALLIGSIGLFITLAVAMIASRKVDWYNLQKR